MPKGSLRERLLPGSVSLGSLLLFAAIIEFATRAVDCSAAIGDADCDRETASRFGASINGAVFDRINVLAGNSSLLDHAMEFAARSSVFAIAGIAALSWFLRTGSDR